MPKLHPILHINKIIADIRFILALNLLFVGLLYWHVGEEKIDITMSWATMAMDQIIISAGWMMAVRQQKQRAADHSLLLSIDRRLAELEKPRKCS